MHPDVAKAAYVDIDRVRPISSPKHSPQAIKMTQNPYNVRWGILGTVPLTTGLKWASKHKYPKHAQV
jgi:hypothetical protein